MASVNPTATAYDKNSALFPGSRCLAIVAVFRNVGLLRVEAGKGGALGLAEVVRCQRAQTSFLIM